MVTEPWEWINFLRLYKMRGANIYKILGPNSREYLRLASERSHERQRQKAMERALQSQRC